MKDVPFGERVIIGYSVGEEILFENSPSLEQRYESVVAATKSCLLQVDANVIKNMGKPGGGGAVAYKED